MKIKLSYWTLNIFKIGVYEIFCNKLSGDVFHLGGVIGRRKLTFANYRVLQFFSFLNAASYFLPVEKKMPCGYFCAKILFFEKPETIWSVFYCKQKEPHIGSTKVGKRTKVRKQVEGRKRP